MPGNYEKYLAAEMLTVMIVETLDALEQAAIDVNTGKIKGQPGLLPDPSRYFATVLVFAMLATASMFGDAASKLAAQLGGVAAITILLSPSPLSKIEGQPKPMLLSALAYFNSLLTGGTAGEPIHTTSTGSTGGAAPATLT